AAVLLLLTGALSDAIAVNDPLSPHIAPQLSRGGTWVAVALFAAGSALVGVVRLPEREGVARDSRVEDQGQTVLGDGGLVDPPGEPLRLDRGAAPVDVGTGELGRDRAAVQQDPDATGLTR